MCMEYFPAADESQWDFIKKLIEESDYYIVIVGGRYGSIDDNNKSYTQKEYEYAIEKGIPTIGFIKKPESILVKDTEQSAKRRAQVDDFRNLVSKKLCKFWATPQELGAVVSRSISQAKKNYPRVGWIRADAIEAISEKEVLQLYKKVEALEKQLSETAKFDNIQIEDLAQGDERVAISFEVTEGPLQKQKKCVETLAMTWDEVAYHILPRMLQPTRENYLKNLLNLVFREIILKRRKTPVEQNISITTNSESIITLKFQFQMLGYITLYPESGINYISITPKGREKLYALRAVKSIGTEESRKKRPLAKARDSS